MNFDSDTNVVDVHIRRLGAKVDDPFESNSSTQFERRAMSSNTDRSRGRWSLDDQWRSTASIGVSTVNGDVARGPELFPASGAEALGAMGAGSPSHALERAMIDRQAFVYVPGDIGGLFRRLNGAPMGDILETLDALLKEKGFYPNVGQYRTQLDTAGIFVRRMEVAMSAVMSKNANQTSYDQFAARNSEILAQLPEDQRNNIAAYFSGSTSTPGLTQSKLIEQYLAWAKLAVFKTRLALDRGAPNRAGDFFKGSPIVAFSDRSKSDKPEEIAEFAKKVRGGNCEEFSATAFVELKQMGARPIRWFKLNNADHAFVMIGHQGRIFQMNDAMLKELGDSMVVCDAWNEDHFVASQIPRRLACYKAPFQATSYADFGC